MPEIRYFPKMRVAYLTSVGPFDQSIPAGLQRLFAWIAANQVQPVGAPLSVFPDDPGVVPAEKLRTEVAIPVGPEVMGSGEVQIKEVGGFEAATTVYNSPLDFDRAYADMYAWLSQEGYRDAGNPMETYLGMGQEFSGEIAIPVARVEASAADTFTLEAADVVIVEEVEAEPRRSPAKAARKKPAAKKTARKKVTSKKVTRKKAAAKKASRKKAATKRARK